MRNKSKHVIKLLGNILSKKYPSFDESPTVPFTDLLEWDLWPGFINLYGMIKQHATIIIRSCYIILLISTASRAGVTTQVGMEEGQVIYTCAISILRDVCKRLRTGDISIMRLREITDKRNQMEKLCVAAASGSGEGDDDMPSAKVLNDCIKQRLKEYQYFENYCQQLNNLILQLHPVTLQGVILYCALRNNL